MFFTRNEIHTYKNTPVYGAFLQTLFAHSLHRHRFCQIPRFIDVATAFQSCIIGK